MHADLVSRERALAEREAAQANGEKKLREREQEVEALKRQLESEPQGSVNNDDEDEEEGDGEEEYEEDDGGEEEDDHDNKKGSAEERALLKLSNSDLVEAIMRERRVHVAVQTQLRKQMEEERSDREEANRTHLVQNCFVVVVLLLMIQTMIGGDSKEGCRDFSVERTCR